MRNIPDVALTGDNVWVLYNGGLSGEFGGTSCAAPLWAAFTALINQQGAMNQHPPVGFLNPALYALGLGSSYAATFHDITVGNNTNATVTSKYFAAAGYDLCTGWGTPNGTNMINALAPPVTAPVLVSTAALAGESCAPTNGVIDPGETVTLNLSFTNLSPVSTTNLVATLQASSAVLLPVGPQTYGALVGGGAAATQPFTFTASGVCGQTISVVWQLQDGASNLGLVTFNFTLGTLNSATTLAQNFDGVTAPALPAGWSTSVIGSQVNWVTTNTSHDTAPNLAFATDTATAGAAYLYSPVIPIVSSSAQLTFRQSYYLEYSTFNHSTTYYDGGVLEIAIGSGNFTDIISAGGSFVTGGYNGTLYSRAGNPLGGRNSWTGNSGGWITTTVTLPASAAGQNVQLRWGCGTDMGNYGPVTGWNVDTISLKDAYYSCCGDSASLSVTQSAAPSPFVVVQNGTYIITVSNIGPDLAAGVVITDTLPSQVTFVSASPGCVYSNGVIVCPIGVIASGGFGSVSVTVQAQQVGVITNTVVAATITPTSGSGNNTAINVTTVGALPAISAPPSNVVAVAGASVTFQVVATGTPPFSYQWYFDSTNAISDASATQLTLTNVQPGQAGSYAVVVSNSAGSITSAPAVLRVLLPPAIVPGSVALTAGSALAISVNSVPGLNYSLEYKNNLDDPTWTLLPASIVIGTGDVITLQDTNPPPAQRYYQVIAN